MFIDTHCHMNFEAFKSRVDDVINDAKKAGINQIIIPGTDVGMSKKAIEIAEKYPGVFAAVGIHPHHVFEVFKKKRSSATNFFHKTNESEKNSFASDLKSIEKLIKSTKVVAIGEIGIDRHYYQKTKHQDYKIDEMFIDLQKEFFIEQIKLAHKYKKALIIHNREAKKDVLKILSGVKRLTSGIKTVFHCCEPDTEILKFAKENQIFIGIDGDIFYSKEKQEFVKKIPLELLVLETDSPYLSPFRKFPNEPKNIKVIAKYIASLLHCSIASIKKQTTENARRLFRI